MIVWAFVPSGTEASEIHDVAAGGNVSRLTRLIRANPRCVEDQDKDRMTPLHSAAAGCRPKAVRILLLAKASVNAADKYQRTPLYHVVRHGTSRRPKDRLLTVQLLLAAGADVNTKEGFYGDTPLHAVASRGYNDIALLLLARRADMNAKNSRELTPLHKAAECGRKEMVQLLLSKRADFNTKSMDEETPLHRAAFGGYAGSGEVAKILIAKGADVNERNGEGSTPLILAAKEGNEHIVPVLLARKADVNAVDKGGMTPLHWAATPCSDRPDLGQERIAKALLAARADHRIKDAQGRTPLMVAQMKSNAGVMRALKKAGARE